MKKEKIEQVGKRKNQKEEGGEIVRKFVKKESNDKRTKGIFLVLLLNM